jgi:hypothetical protein
MKEIKGLESLTQNEFILLNEMSKGNPTM